MQSDRAGSFFPNKEYGGNREKRAKSSHDIAASPVAVVALLSAIAVWGMLEVVVVVQIL